MKYTRIICLLLTALSLCEGLQAQDQDTLAPKAWEHSIALNFYFFQDPFIILPTYEVNKGHLHLGARYNYEDLETFSFWAGYNFMGGKSLEFVITPMAGWIVGNTDGFGGGVLIQLDYKRFSFYAESEYVFDAQDDENDYFYNWTDISYTLTDWLYAGISLQRTKLYETDVDIQSGLLLGTSWKGIDMATYFYNPFLDESFLILTLSKDF